MFDVYVFERELEFFASAQDFDRATAKAKDASLEAGVSEALVYNDDGCIIAVFVAGEEVDLEAYMDNDFADEYDDTYDEHGYDPYSGCFDMDL